MRAKRVAVEKSLLLTLCFLPLQATAYIGPGLGGGMIAAIVGLITAFVIAVWSVLYFPIKRAINRRIHPPAATEEDEPVSAEPGSSTNQVQPVSSDEDH